MEDLRISSKKFIKLNTNKSIPKLVSGMNIDLLMIWLLIWSSLMVVSCGLAKITMVMSNPIALLKVTVHLV